MKFDFWHIVLAGVLIIVAAWILIKVLGALVSFVLWLMTVLLILAAIGAIIYFGYLLIRPRGSRL